VDRIEKREVVADLRKTFGSVESVIVTHNLGLSAAEITNLRRDTRARGATFRVAKNRLARLALEGSAFEGISDLLTGPTALAYSSDPVAAAKVVVAFAKKNEKLVILGGAMAGQTLDVAGVRALASLPSLDELRGQLVGLIQAPATKIAGVVQAPAGQLARVLKAYADQSV
jgi:large subunit ribosomal protein L10